MQCTKLSCFSPTGSGVNHCRQSTKTYLKILAKGKQKWMLVNCTSHYNQSYSMLIVVIYDNKQLKDARQYSHFNEI